MRKVELIIIAVIVVFFILYYLIEKRRLQKLKRFAEDENSRCHEECGPVLPIPPTVPCITDWTSTFTADQSVRVLGDAYGCVTTDGDNKVLVACTRSGISRWNVDGTLDTTFGTSGYTDLQVPGTFNNSGANTYYQFAWKQIKVASDASIFIVGSASADGFANGICVLWKLLPSGLPDTSFGTNGVWKRETYPKSLGVSVDFQSDGKIIVQGNEDAPDYTGDWFNGYRDVFVTRLTSVGVLDTTFGTSGYFKLPPPGRFYFIAGYYVGVSSDDYIRVACDGYDGNDTPYFYGFGAFRLTPSGQLDTSYGDTGYVSWAISGTDVYQFARCGLLSSDGSLYVGGHMQINDPFVLSGSNITVVKFDPDGVLDTTWNGTGYQHLQQYISLGPGFVERVDSDLTGLCETCDGGLLACGSKVTEGRSCKFVVRFDSDGAVDDTFGNGDGTQENPMGFLNTCDQAVYYSGIAITPESIVHVVSYYHPSGPSFTGIQDKIEFPI
jgi:uncharacterized delta-60 repeat protein